MKKILILIVILLSLPNAAWADEADDAYERRDYRTAFRLYKQRAEQGDAKAQFQLFHMYRLSLGVTGNFSEALRWLQEAANQGLVDAQAMLGDVYYTELRSHLPTKYVDRKNFPKAFKWTRKAAEQGGIGAQLQLAYMYDKGHGVTQSYSQALYWLQKGIDGGAYKDGYIYPYKFGSVLGIQKKLLTRGFDPGPADGKPGSKTQTAIRRFQSHLGITVDGQMSQELLDRLGGEQVVRTPSKSFKTPVVKRRRVGFGTYHALVIGNNDYRHLSDLETADDDARAVADLLRKKYGFNVKLSLNATRSDIISALSRLRRELSTSDNLLIYYAGHGEIDKATKRGYWLPINAERHSPANWIANEDITNELKAMRAKHVLVIADSCYSGTLTRSPGTASIKEGGKEEWVQRMVERRSRTALTSGGLEPVLDTGGGNHSVFARAFLQTLEENREVIDMDSLFETIRRRVILNADQTPKYKDIRKADHYDGDFVLVPR